MPFYSRVETNKKIILDVNNLLLGNIKPDLVFLNVVNKKKFTINVNESKN